jgi:hypothetical protein
MVTIPMFFVKYLRQVPTMNDTFLVINVMKSRQEGEGEEQE